MKFIVIAIVVGALVVVGAVGMWYYKTKFYVPDKGRMERDLSDTVVSCSYSVSGGMEGGSTCITVSLNDKGEVWYNYSDTPYNGAETETVSRQVSGEVIEKIRKLCREYGVLSWGELPYSDLQLLDAPVTTITFIYGDNEHYSVNSDRELPKKGEKLFSEIYEILNDSNN